MRISKKNQILNSNSIYKFTKRYLKHNHIFLFIENMIFGNFLVHIFCKVKYIVFRLHEFVHVILSLSYTQNCSKHIVFCNRNYSTKNIITCVKCLRLAEFNDIGNVHHVDKIRAVHHNTITSNISYFMIFIYIYHISYYCISSQ